jgi:hypothetical protein
MEVLRLEGCFSVSSEMGWPCLKSGFPDLGVIDYFIVKMSAPLKKIQLYRIPDRLLATDSCLRV